MKALITPREGESLLTLAHRCDALYICPTGESGEFLGPLVAYAGKDKVHGKNLVGGIYFNFRKIEEHPTAVLAFAREAAKKIQNQGLEYSFDRICGIPNGGRSFGQMLALSLGKRFSYPEKKPKKTGEGLKQEYEWDLSQFEFEKGERVAVAEDVFNNFNNTAETLNAISNTGAVVTILVGALNRSPHHPHTYRSYFGLPVIAAHQEPFAEFAQHDPKVADYIASPDNLVKEVKANWPRLMQVMEKYKKD